MGITCMIKWNRNIRGVHTQKESCLFQYADGCYNNVFLHGTERSLKAALDLVFQFSNYLKYSGFKPNFWKTKTIWIWSKSQSSEILCQYLKLKWTNDDSSILGIKFDSCLTNINEINFEPKLAIISEWITEIKDSWPL